MSCSMPKWHDILLYDGRNGAATWGGCGFFVLYGEVYMWTRRPCSHFGCQELTTRRYCDKHLAQHQKEEQQRGRLSDREYNHRRPDYHSLYHSRRWARLRIQKLSQHPWCAMCLQLGKRTVAGEVDHIIPHKGNRDLFYDENNFQSLCTSCHSRKTAKEGRKS